MSSTIPENRTVGRDFLFIGEHPAIDFVNTLSMAQGEPEDVLRTWTDVADWLSAAGLSNDSNFTVSRGTAALQSVLDLRHAWTEVLAKLVAGGKVSDEFLQSLNAFLMEDPFCEIIQRDGKKAFRLVRSASGVGGEKLVLGTLARAIAHFLVNANLKYLHRCANTVSCTLYFYDTTKNHRRQWCRAAVCGNRHKVAAFRERRKGA
jgi:predicted RNA-binding Zn ribbon-like protein